MPFEPLFGRAHAMNRANCSTLSTGDEENVSRGVAVSTIDDGELTWPD
jgi:hypothetical protein